MLCPADFIQRKLQLELLLEKDGAAFILFVVIVGLVGEGRWPLELRTASQALIVQQ